MLSKTKTIKILPTLGPYTASKAALLALSDIIRPELAGTGVEVDKQIFLK